MYYVILNHTTIRADIMRDGWGTPAKFNHKYNAAKAGEDALGGDVYEYLVVKSIEQ